MTNISVEALDPTVPSDVQEMAWLRRVLPVLSREYPGYQWLVSVDVVGKIMQIGLALPDRSGAMLPWAYVIHLDKYSDNKVKRAGGELLERRKLSRERAPSDAFSLARSNGMDVMGATWAPSWAKKIA